MIDWTKAFGLFLLSFILLSAPARTTLAAHKVLKNRYEMFNCQNYMESLSEDERAKRVDEMMESAIKNEYASPQMLMTLLNQVRAWKDVVETRELKELAEIIAHPRMTSELLTEAGSTVLDLIQAARVRGESNFDLHFELIAKIISHQKVDAAGLAQAMSAVLTIARGAVSDARIQDQLSAILEHPRMTSELLTEAAASVSKLVHSTRYELKEDNFDLHFALIVKITAHPKAGAESISHAMTALLTMPSDAISGSKTFELLTFLAKHPKTSGKTMMDIFSVLLSSRVSKGEKPQMEEILEHILAKIETDPSINEAMLPRKEVLLQTLDAQSPYTIEFYSRLLTRMPRLTGEFFILAPESLKLSFVQDPKTPAALVRSVLERAQSFETVKAAFDHPNLDVHAVKDYWTNVKSRKDFKTVQHLILLTKTAKMRFAAVLSLRGFLDVADPQMLQAPEFASKLSEVIIKLMAHDKTNEALVAQGILAFKATGGVKGTANLAVELASSSAIGEKGMITLASFLVHLDPAASHIDNMSPALKTIEARSPGLIRKLMVGDGPMNFDEELDRMAEKIQR